MSSLSYQPHAGPSHVAFPYGESTTSALSVLGDQLPVNRGPNDIYDEDTHGLLTETQFALQLYAEDLQLSTMIAELTIEDVAELQGQQMGNGRDDASPSDAALALELCAEEAQLCIRIQNDHLFALKIHEAENGSSSPAEEITTPQTTVRPDTPRPTNKTCIICRDPIRGVTIHIPCGHDCDVGCMVDLFTACTRDEALYPPRCCQQPISLLSVKEHLGEDLLSLFVQKSHEFETQKRVYCARQGCSSFVGAEHTNGNDSAAPAALLCSAAGCKTLTCSRCKSQVNVNSAHICVVDPSASDRLVLDLARESGWAQCPGCSRLVERYMGCPHITCLCSTEFCYLCQARWKVCECRREG